MCLRPFLRIDEQAKGFLPEERILLPFVCMPTVIVPQKEEEWTKENNDLFHEFATDNRFHHSFSGDDRFDCCCRPARLAAAAAASVPSGPPVGGKWERKMGRQVGKSDER